MTFDESRILAGIERLRSKGLDFDLGLSDAEVGAIEGQFGFIFPPDLRFFLQAALPVSPYFPNWRKDTEDTLRKSFVDCTLSGVLFDVEHNRFWYPAWGEKPEETRIAVELAAEHLRLAPKMIPIGDRVFTKCIPAVPCAAGNPVFSVHQTDILHAGRDLADYLDWFARPTEMFDKDEERGRSPTPAFSEDYKKIEFWTEVARWNVTGNWT